jgi:SNF2 family DNA or RNA helicase
MSSVELYPFQERILDETQLYNRVAYYIDMGLGKTYIGSEKAARLETPVTLVVCQKSKVQDWLEQFNKHYGEYEVYDLTKKVEFEMFFCAAENPSGRIAGIINYDLIFRRKEFLGLIKFTLLLDESSQIQNDQAKRTRFIMNMNPDNVILLSGTPTSGKYENLWSQLNMIGWEISRKVYNAHYVNWKMIEVKGFPLGVVDKAKPYKNVERLKSKMREYGAVFLKTEEVFDLPEQNFIEKLVPTTKEYRRFQNDKIVRIGDIELIGDTSLTFRLYSRMLCGHLNPMKLTAFNDILESTNDRLIVFYNYDAELTALKLLIAKSDKPISEINGHTKDLNAYETEENSVTLAQYQAGALGLNLQKANKIVYFTPPDKSDLFEQSKKRIHRIGQNKPCFYYMLICQNSVEDREIYPLLGRRKEYTDELFKEKTS